MKWPRHNAPVHTHLSTQLSVDILSPTVEELAGTLATTMTPSLASSVPSSVTAVPSPSLLDTPCPKPRRISRKPVPQPGRCEEKRGGSQTSLSPVMAGHNIVLWASGSDEGSRISTEVVPGRTSSKPPNTDKVALQTRLSVESSGWCDATPEQKAELKNRISAMYMYGSQSQRRLDASSSSPQSPGAIQYQATNGIQDEGMGKTCPFREPEIGLRLTAGDKGSSPRSFPLVHRRELPKQNHVHHHGSELVDGS